MAMVSVMFKNENNELPDFLFKDDVVTSKFGEWLKEYYCKPRGVKHLLENIDSVETRPPNYLLILDLSLCFW